MEKFWENFAEEMFLNLHNFGNSWFNQYGSWNNWGKFTKETIEKVIPKVGIKLGFEPNEILPEEKKIDFVFGRYINNIFKTEFAIEHENNPSTYNEEIIKLRDKPNHWKKVLISYYHWHDNDIYGVGKENFL